MTKINEVTSSTTLQEESTVLHQYNALSRFTEKMVNEVIQGNLVFQYCMTMHVNDIQVKSDYNSVISA